MIFYTLKGPGHTLEIHDDKICLKKRSWLWIFGGKGSTRTWEIEKLSQFNITIPQYLLWGKVEWKDFAGEAGAFRFSTNPLMMKKIELYLQKRIIKNHQRVIAPAAPVAGKKSRKTPPPAQAA